MRSEIHTTDSSRVGERRTERRRRSTAKSDPVSLRSAASKATVRGRMPQHGHQADSVGVDPEQLHVEEERPPGDGVPVSVLEGRQRPECSPESVRWWCTTGLLTTYPDASDAVKAVRAPARTPLVGPRTPRPPLPAGGWCDAVAAMGRAFILLSLTRTMARLALVVKSSDTLELTPWAEQRGDTWRAEWERGAVPWLGPLQPAESAEGETH